MVIRRRVTLPASRIIASVNERGTPGGVDVNMSENKREAAALLARLPPAVIRRELASLRRRLEREDFQSETFEGQPAGDPGD